MFFGLLDDECSTAVVSSFVENEKHFVPLA